MSETSKPTGSQDTSSKARLPGRRVSDVIDNGLWPDLPQRKLEDLMNTDIGILEVRILHSREYNNDYAVVKCMDGKGEEFTTVCGGTVAVEKLKGLLETQSFPITGQFTEVIPKKGGRAYYDLV